MAMFYLVCYDVVEDCRRNRVAHLLESYGMRVQKSVFECCLEPPQYRLLRERLTEYIHPDEDQVRFYPLSQSNRNKVEVLGWQPAFVVDQIAFIV